MVKAMKEKQRLDAQNKALCYALRNPPKGVKKTKLSAIVKQKLVKFPNGRHRLRAPFQRLLLLSWLRRKREGEKQAGERQPKLRIERS